MPFPDAFKIFDSHSLDMHGMPSAFAYIALSFPLKDFKTLRPFLESPKILRSRI